jgi:arginine utilization protein RocB
LCVINEEKKRKDYLTEQYISSIEQLIDLLKYKTHSMENEDENFNEIDNQCQQYFEQLNETSREVTATIAITKFYEQLQKLKSSVGLSEKAESEK